MVGSNLKDVVNAWLDGKVVEFKSGDDWLTKAAYDGNADIQFYYNVEYRIKPKTIKIGEYDVPEPLRKAPDVRSSYYFPSIDGRAPEGCLFVRYRWDGRELDKTLLSRGLVHRTQEAAELHAKALISLTEVKS